MAVVCVLGDGRRTVVVPSRSSWMRNWAHSLGTPSLVQAIWRAGLLMLSKARRMSVPGRDETGGVGFFGMFQGVYEEE